MTVGKEQTYFIQPVQTSLQKVTDYFNALAKYKRGVKVMQDIMELANKEGVAAGRYAFPDKIEGNWPMQYGEDKFLVGVRPTGDVQLHAGADFAAKVEKLPSVAALKRA